MQITTVPFILLKFEVAAEQPFVQYVLTQCLSLQAHAGLNSQLNMLIDSRIASNSTKFQKNLLREAYRDLKTLIKAKSTMPFEKCVYHPPLYHAHFPNAPLTTRPTRLRTGQDLAVFCPPPKQDYSIGSLVPVVEPAPQDEVQKLREQICQCKEALDAINTIRRFEIHRSFGEGKVRNMELLDMLKNREVSYRRELVKLMEELDGEYLTYGDDLVGCREWCDD